MAERIRGPLTVAKGLFSNQNGEKRPEQDGERNKRGGKSPFIDTFCHSFVRLFPLDRTPKRPVRLLPELILFSLVYRLRRFPAIITFKFRPKSEVHPWQMFTVNDASIF